MTANDIKNKIEEYNNCQTQRKWKMNENEIFYENEYIRVYRLDSSNKWTGPDTMEKMWSIIFKPKKSFISLCTYQELKKVLKIRVTKVEKGKFIGNYGIRIYGMKREPNCEIVKMILNFIFANNNL